MAKVLIVYTTRTGDTKDIAERIAEGVRFEGAEAEMVDAPRLKKNRIWKDMPPMSLGLPPIMGICSSP